MGNVTGTASRAVADADGNTISSTYGKLAGNNTWTGFNIYEQAIRVAKTSGDSEIEIVNKNIDITSNTSTEMGDIRFFDKNNKITGGLRVTYTNTQVQNSLSARSWSSDGTIYSNVAINIVSNYQNNAAYISITNDFLPTSTNTLRLGNASYQWSAVYAQTYYYNGTAWGLDKANTWTGNNTFTSTITTKTNVDRTVAPTSDSTYGTIICRDKNGSAMFRMQGTIKTDLSNVWDMMMVAPNASYITFFKYTYINYAKRGIPFMCIMIFYHYFFS